jgi:prephenate dehydratase
VFKRYDFNLTSIDTRPGRRRNWQYVFFVECEEGTTAAAAAVAGTTRTFSKNEYLQDEVGEEDVGENLRNILKDLATYTESLRYLGRFVDQLQQEHS